MGLFNVKGLMERNLIPPKDWEPPQTAAGWEPGSAMPLDFSVQESIRKAEEEEAIEESDSQLAKDERRIEDPLAYYLPYHWYPENWGIYFRITKMSADFASFMHLYGGNLSKSHGGEFQSQLWQLYCVTVEWHELGHHTLEDLATIREAEGTAKYAYLDADEEQFCEYHAFETVTGQRYPRPPSEWSPLVRYQAKQHNILNLGPSLHALYQHWGRNRNGTNRYRLRVTSRMSNHCNILWSPLWKLHKSGGRTFAALDEIWDKLYVTRL